jgi:uncharacterized protein
MFANTVQSSGCCLDPIGPVLKPLPHLFVTRHGAVERVQRSRIKPMIIDGYTQYHEDSLQTGDPAQEVNRLIKELDRTRVDVAVLVDSCLCRDGDVRKSNDRALAAIREFPHRLIAFANIKPAAGERAALDEMNRTVGAGDFRGVSIDPALDYIPANSPLMYTIIESAIHYDVPVWISTGGYPGATPTLVGSLAAKYPRAKIICGHMGCELFYDAICAGRRHPSLFFDISLQGRASFHAALRELGASRLIYGSGFPHAGAALMKDVVERTRMPAAAKERILGGNIAELIGTAVTKELETWAGQIPAFA